MNITKAVKRKINELYPKNEVILFGSRARGDFHDESDWDFLILLYKEGPYLKDKQIIRDALYEIELAYSQVIGTIIHTKTEWERREVMPLYKEIKKDGQVCEV